MDDVLLLVGAACVALAVLVYLMWRDATGQEWGNFSQGEKKRWKHDEAEKKGKK